MDGNKMRTQTRAAGPHRPYEESFFAAKVDGIMRVAGFVRGEDGTWQKRATAVVTRNPAADFASSDPSKQT